MSHPIPGFHTMKNAEVLSMPIGHFPQQILSTFQIPRSTNQSSQKVTNFKTSQLVELPLDLSHPRFLYHLNHLPKSPTES